MSSFPPVELPAAEFPAGLREIPQPPKQLYYRGELPPPDLKLLAVVGSRRYSTYGQQVVNHLIDGLKGHPIGIVSGLALGIDSLAHEAALRNDLYTLAIPGSGLDDNVIYPARHRPLARKILERGGGLLSEFEPDFQATKWSFVTRNRIMAGIATATLVVEATEQSGTLVTARLTVDYNRELLVVPGNIFATTAAGPHLFLKLGATPVTTATDILQVLGIDLDASPHQAQLGAVALTETEQALVALLQEPLERDRLIRRSGLPAHEANVLLMQLEMRGIIACEQNIYRAIS